MADASIFDAMRIPINVLIAMDNRAFHFALQPWHYGVRVIHVVSASAFFGAILAVDLRMMGFGQMLSVSQVKRQLMWLLHVSFGVVILTGILLLAYDPLHTGSHAYFSPKLVLILAGIIHAVVFHHTGRKHLHGMGGQGKRSPWLACFAAMSALVWTGVFIFSSLNVEGIPKVLLR